MAADIGDPTLARSLSKHNPNRCSALSAQLDDDVVQRARGIGDAVSGIRHVAIGLTTLEHVEVIVTLEEFDNRSPIGFFGRPFGFPGGVGVDASGRRAATLCFPALLNIAEGREAF